ncbi:MAG TPA: hypothetical protein VLK25_08100 [Allosphingosinicella sp.]|nr:hypothetical protein [Allosphingosinicella sp.]
MRVATVKATLKGAVIATLAIFGWAQRSMAQGGLVDLVPITEFTDERGVDIAGAVYRHREDLVGIGAGPHPLSLDLTIVSPGQFLQSGCVGYGDIGHATYLGLSTHAYYGGRAWSPEMNVALPFQSGKFALYGAWTNGRQIAGGDQYFTMTNNGGVLINYVGVDGTEADFPPLGNAAQTGSWESGVSGGVTQIRYPDGEVWTYRYNVVGYNSGSGPGGCGSGQLTRLRSIVSSRGYAIQLNYASEATTTLTASGAVRDWVSPVRATVYNKASVLCDEALLQSCASVTALTSAVTFAYDRDSRTVTITKPNGEQVGLTFSLNSTLNLVGVSRPGGASRTMNYAEYNQWFGEHEVTVRSLASLTEAGRTWRYDYALLDSSGNATIAVTEPGGATSTHESGSTYVYRSIDALQRETIDGRSGIARFASRRYPEGNQVTADYDARGNLNLVRQIPKPGSELPTLQASAIFPPSCGAADRRTCNLPTSTTDYNGNTTDYAYDPAHGGVLTVTGPAVNGVRPQTRHSYAQRYAWISNGSGGYVQAATPVWVRTSTSSCRTSAATGNPAFPCALAGDEVLTQYDYGPNAGPNTLLLRGQTVTATDGGVTTTLRTCYGYDVNGRRISETPPNAGLTACP